jgi:hypothetical protein
MAPHYPLALQVSARQVRGQETLLHDSETYPEAERDAVAVGVVQHARTSQGGCGIMLEELIPLLPIIITK